MKLTTPDISILCYYIAISHCCTENKKQKTKLKQCCSLYTLLLFLLFDSDRNIYNTNFKQNAVGHCVAPITTFRITDTFLTLLCFLRLKNFLQTVEIYSWTCIFWLVYHNKVKHYLLWTVNVESSVLKKGIDLFFFFVTHSFTFYFAWDDWISRIRLYIFCLLKVCILVKEIELSKELQKWLHNITEKKAQSERLW